MFIHNLTVLATFSSNQLEEPRENVSLLNPGKAAGQFGLSFEAGDSANGATFLLTAQSCIMAGGNTVYKFNITRPKPERNKLIAK